MRVGPTTVVKPPGKVTVGPEITNVCVLAGRTTVDPGAVIVVKEPEIEVVKVEAGSVMVGPTTVNVSVLPGKINVLPGAVTVVKEPEIDVV